MRIITTRLVEGAVRHLVVDAPDDATVEDLRRRHDALARADAEAAPARADAETAPAGADAEAAPMRPGDPRRAPAASERPLLHGAELAPRRALGQASAREDLLPSDPAPRSGVPADGLPWLIVDSGPDAGAAAPLPPGRWVTIGRDPGCELAIADPGLSRRHVRIRQDRDGVVVEDLGSTNGLRWEHSSRLEDGTHGSRRLHRGQDEPAEPGEPSGRGDGATYLWPSGDRLLVGASGIVVLPRPAAPARLVPDRGRLVLTAWPRVVPVVSEREFTTPAPPERRVVRAPSPWTWGLPLVGVAVAAVLRMPWLLLFGLLGPAMVLGHHLGDRRLARQEHEEACRRHAELRQRQQEAADDALRAELTTRREIDQGVRGIVSSLLPRPSVELWQCDAEPPRVTLGEHRRPSAVHLEGEALTHRSAPLAHVVDGPLVLAGPSQLRDGLARSLILQLATRHPPGRWSVVVDHASPPGEDWDLLGWLPHTTGTAPPDGAGLCWGRGLMLVDDPAQAPPGSVVVSVTGPDHAVLRRPGDTEVTFRPTAVGLHRARHLARRLAPLRQVDQRLVTPAGSAGTDALPAPSADGGPTLGDLGGWPRTVAEARAAWTHPSTDLPLGTDAAGESFRVDLTTDGPHALVAGTTGSGKSELLRSLVTSLAIQSSPADLALLLVDFKGGSSLGEIASLPHVAGLVTDLDPHLAHRVLTSLRAELTRREHLLAEAQVADFDGYRRRRAAAPTRYAALPRLVVVIDEFRVLADEVPEVMTGLVRLAAVGRSLGVHLVLATQRPAGVVGADLRANVNLRIALRVRDVTDSHDVLDHAAAASLPEGRPGLALCRTGATPPRTVQVARAAPPARRSEVIWAIHDAEDLWDARTRMARPDPRDPGGDGAVEDPGDDDGIAELVAVLAQAAEQAGLAPPTIWQPPLPAVLRDADTGLSPDCWAVADRPERQAREGLTWAGEGHLAVVGSARSGRTTAVRALVGRLPPAWLVVLDLGRALSDTELATHPGRCGWVTPDDLAHGLRVLDQVDRAVAARQAAHAPTEPGGSTPDSSRASAVGSAPGSAHPSRTAGHAPHPIVLVLDGWDRFVDLFADLDRGRPLDIVRRILREGPAVGVVAVVTGDRSLLLGAMAALLPETWALRLNDPADLLLSGLRAAQVPRHQPPGRVVRTRDGVEAQVVLPRGPGGRGCSEDASQQAPPGDPPLRCRPLPSRWVPGPGHEGAEGGAAPAWAVGGDAAEPLRRPPLPLLVLGPPASGRSSALHALAQGEPYLLVDGADPPPPDELAAQLAAREPGCLLLVDDAHLLVGTTVEDSLVRHLQGDSAAPLDHTAGAAAHLGFIVSADLEVAASTYRGLIPLAARTRTALVLNPSSPTQGAIVGVSLPIGDPPLPGRGVLVHRGTCTRTQVAAPPPAGTMPRAAP